jgi:hypothetical protein
MGLSTNGKPITPWKGSWAEQMPAFKLSLQAKHEQEAAAKHTPIIINKKDLNP